MKRKYQGSVVGGRKENTSIKERDFRETEKKKGEGAKPSQILNAMPRSDLTAASQICALNAFENPPPFLSAPVTQL